MAMEHEVRKTELKYVRWMCGFTLKERNRSAEISEMLGLEALSPVIKKGFTTISNYCCMTIFS